MHAQKFLSCVYRIHAKHGFGFGLNHIVDVLCGADTEPIRQRGHNELSTFGIGRDLKRNQWQAIGRELLRLNLVECSPGKFATLLLTSSGRTVLRERSPITLTKHVDLTKQTATPRAGAIECDEALFERLRAVRRKLADERDVPAYVIFSDVSLREMARAYPTSAVEFQNISGVGKQKLKDFADPFLVRNWAITWQRIRAKRSATLSILSHAGLRSTTVRRRRFGVFAMANRSMKFRACVDSC